jgi:photosynthetic reaction center cytochrome c subunit
MKNTTWIFLTAAAAIMVILVVAIPDWQTHPHGVELGAPGTSMVQFDNKSPWDALLRQGGGNQNAISANAAFIAAHPRWSSDSAMKSVTQSMIAMTEHLNKAWGSHVGATGVTCYSCHRGEDVPPETWFSHPALVTPSMFGRSENWNENADTVRKFFPDNSWALYFLHDEPIRAQSSTALRGDTVASEIEVKRVYELMMQMSDGIGVNCGYCHNSRAFADWKQSTPNRWTAFYAIRMVRDINTNYLLQVGRTLGQTKEATKVNTLAVRPEDRGPQPVNGFVVCATCHYGHSKPDQGLPTVFPLAKLDKAAAVALAAAPY